MQYVIVFVTTKNKKEAKKIGSSLLNMRIVACINTVENIDSRFWWNGKKEHAKECLLMMKTKKTALRKLIKIVKSLHSYDVPEIIAMPILAGNKDYLDWIKSEVN